jgi:hypothetical protein
VLEEAETMAGVIAAELTWTSTVAPVTASPGPARTTPVSGAGSCLGKDRGWHGENDRRCNCEDDVSCFHVYLRVVPRRRLFQSLDETTATPLLLTFLRNETHPFRKESSRARTGW